MKKVFLIILFMFLAIPCLGEQTLFLNKTWDKNASKILYEYILNEHDMTPEKAYDAFGYKLSDVRAIFYDLNSDGVNEILGYINMPLFYCVEGIQLFILKKETNKLYNNLTFTNFYPNSGIEILKSKTENFFNLKIYYTHISLVESPQSYINTNYSSKTLKYNKNEYKYY